MRYSNIAIAAFGYELPPNVMSSDDLEDRLEPVYRALRLQKGQLEAITGIRERRLWDPGFPMSRGAVAAGRKALSRTGIDPADLGMLVYGGVCRDHLEPATACAVADGLGIGPETQIFDVSNACLGVLNGMVQAANAIELGQMDSAMIVSCESAREIIDLTIERLNHSRDMTIFKKTIATLTGGSGAVAVILTTSRKAPSGHRMIGGVARSAAEHHRLCVWGREGGFASHSQDVLETDSVNVLKNGVTLGLDTFDAFRRELSLSDDQPDKIICHQVGATHQRTILESIGIPAEKDFTTFQYLGNIGTVSLPITAAIADERRVLKPGDMVGLLGIGSGLNCMMLGVEW
jgi:3-oxoacyl-[acyl-carrier-protein] synthase-3